jgi:hypothetical protein
VECIKVIGSILPGTDVIIAIFGDKIGAFLKTQCYEKIFAVVGAKNANFFAKCLGGNNTKS